MSHAWHAQQIPAPIPLLHAIQAVPEHSVTSCPPGKLFSLSGVLIPAGNSHWSSSGMSGCWQDHSIAPDQVLWVLSASGCVDPECNPEFVLQLWVSPWKSVGFISTSVSQPVKYLQIFPARPTSHTLHTLSFSCFQLLLLSPKSSGICLPDGRDVSGAKSIPKSPRVPKTARKVPLPAVPTLLTRGLLLVVGFGDQIHLLG